ncbi:hypothetical protein SmJEL517_g05905 [Synchytrium microbalum]|uniref:Uncharacterized protein n=1 Tax=Synchytrium microbalum TaxID=1806994 RepID=A0A507BXP8_9FUNG|nr:uncharacterized protein SmJEL517_g05905 [Synchytrium microbalum]TPX30564.1 hypothetical protein SmJEL517_g05905 [Synchytrium microbalum]
METFMEGDLFAEQRASTQGTDDDEQATNGQAMSSNSGLLYLLDLASLPHDAQWNDWIASNPTLATLITNLNAILKQDAGDTIESLKVKLEQVRAEKLLIETNSEQAAHTLAQRNKSFQNEIHTIRSRLNDCESELSQKNAALATTQSENSVLSARVKAMETEVQSSKSTEGKLDSEKRDLATLLDRKLVEISSLKDQIEALVQQTESLRTEYRTQSEEIAKLQSETLNSRHQLDARTQEVDQLKKHNEWMNQEMDRKANEFQQYRTEKMEEITSLHQQLDAAMQERNLFESRAQSHSKRANDFEAKLTSALEKAQEASNRLAIQEQQFKTEMRIQQRLVDQSNSLAKEREDQWKEMSHGLAEREEECRDLRVKLEQVEQNTRNDRASMQAQLDAKEDELEALRTRLSGAGPSTPAPGARNESSPFMSGSPSSSITQLYARNHALEDENRVLKRKLEGLETHAAATADRVKNEIGPAYQQAMHENETIKAENAKIFKELGIVLKQREEAIEREQAVVKQVAALKRDKTNMHGSIMDMKKTITALILGLEEVRAGSLASLEARFKITLSAPPSSSTMGNGAAADFDVEVFRSVDQLVAQNEGLKRSVLSLSDELTQLQNNVVERIRMGIEDARTKDESRFTSLKDEVRRITLRCDSLQRENEGLRRRLEYVNTSNSTGRNSFGGMSSSRPTSPDGDGMGDEYKALYESAQQELDNLRREAGIDTQTLKNDSSRLAHENGELNVQLTRVKTQLELADQRYSILQHHLDAKETELRRVVDTNRDLNTKLAAMDKRIQETDNKCRSALDESSKHRSDVSILRAQLEVLKNVEERSKNEVSFHINERQRLDLLLKDLQRAQDAFERSSADQTRRLEERCASLDRELTAAKRQGAELSDELRGLSARRESEARDAQVKAERLTAELQKVHQDLAVSKTKEEGLTERVKDLTQRLAVSEERLAVYENRGARRVGSNGNNEQPGPQEMLQEVEAQLVQARTDLDAAKEDLRIEQERVATFKSVADTLEQDLSRTSTAFDEYRRDTDAQIQQFQQKVAQLEETKRDLEENLSRIANQVTETLEKADADRIQYQNDKKTWEDRIESLSASETMAVRGQEQLRQDMLRHNTEVLDARRKYEMEIVEHSKAIQELQRIKDEVVKVKDELTDARERLNVSESSARSSQTSWDEIRRGLDAELAEVKKNYDELKEQNNILLSQLEKVSSEATRIQMQEGGDGSGNSISVTGPQSLATDSENLKEVIKFIRRERDILQSKHELALQETQRLRQQTEHLQRSLDETRTLLDEERHRSRQALDTERHHTELLEQVNNLNILRESNSTLRQQYESASRRSTDLETRLRQMEGQLHPLREQVATLEAEVEERKKQVKLLEEDNTRWKARSTAIMQKYDRIDPVEHQQFKDQNESYRLEIERLNAEVAPQQARFDAILAEKESLVGERDSFKTQWETVKKELEGQQDIIRRARATIKAIKDVREKNAALEVELAAVRTQYDEKAIEITALRAELGTAQAAVVEIEKAKTALVQSSNAKMVKAKEDRNRLRDEKNELANKIGELETRITQLQSELSSQSGGGDSSAEVARLTTELNKSQSEVTAIRAEIEQLRKAAGNHLTEIQSRDMKLGLLKATAEKKESDLKQQKEMISRLESQIKELEKSLEASSNSAPVIQTSQPSHQSPPHVSSTTITSPKPVAVVPSTIPHIPQTTAVSSAPSIKSPTSTSVRPSTQQTPAKRTRDSTPAQSPATASADDSIGQPAAKRLRPSEDTVESKLVVQVDQREVSPIKEVPRATTPKVATPRAATPHAATPVRVSTPAPVEVKVKEEPPIIPSSTTEEPIVVEEYLEELQDTTADSQPLAETPIVEDVTLDQQPSTSTPGATGEGAEELNVDTPGSYQEPGTDVNMADAEDGELKYDEDVNMNEGDEDGELHEDELQRQEEEEYETEEQSFEIIPQEDQPEENAAAPEVGQEVDYEDEQDVEMGDVAFTEQVGGNEAYQEEEEANYEEEDLPQEHPVTNEEQPVNTEAGQEYLETYDSPYVPAADGQEEERHPSQEAFEEGEQLEDAVEDGEDTSAPAVVAEAPVIEQVNSMEDLLPEEEEIEVEQEHIAPLIDPAVVVDDVQETTVIEDESIGPTDETKVDVPVSQTDIQVDVTDISTAPHTSDVVMEAESKPMEEEVVTESTMATPGVPIVETRATATPILSAVAPRPSTPVVGSTTTGFSFLSGPTSSSSTPIVPPAPSIPTESPKISSRFGKLSGSVAATTDPAPSQPLNTNAPEFVPRPLTPSAPLSQDGMAMTERIKARLALQAEEAAKSLTLPDAAGGEMSRKRVQREPPRQLQDRVGEKIDRLPKPLPVGLVQQQLLNPAVPISGAVTATQPQPHQTTTATRPATRSISRGSARIAGASGTRIAGTSVNPLFAAAMSALPPDSSSPLPPRPIGGGILGRAATGAGRGRGTTPEGGAPGRGGGGILGRGRGRKPDDASG